MRIAPAPRAASIQVQVGYRVWHAGTQPVKTPVMVPVRNKYTVEGIRTWTRPSISVMVPQPQQPWTLLQPHRSSLPFTKQGLERARCGARRSRARWSCGRPSRRRPSRPRQSWSRLPCPRRSAPRPTALLAHTPQTFESYSIRPHTSDHLTVGTPSAQCHKPTNLCLCVSACRRQLLPAAFRLFADRAIAGT